MGLFKENKQAIYFLLIFVGLYLSLNSLYGVYINAWAPDPDPITRWITQQVSFLLSFFDPGIHAVGVPGSGNVAIDNSMHRVLLVFEGCNGLNVMIVFVCFLAAFRGNIKSTLLFAVMGIATIYFLNLGRVATLYFIAEAFPQYLYFFHKYLLTGVLYMFVFGMWIVWVNRYRRVGA
jgi:exosortase family protein XrtF